MGEPGSDTCSEPLRPDLPQLSSDLRTVPGEGPRDLGLMDALEVSDQPVELIQRLLGRSPIALRLPLLFVSWTHLDAV